MAADSGTAAAVVVHRDSLAILDSSGHVVADVRLQGRPGPITVLNGSAWVGIGEHSLVRVDLDNRRVVSRTTLPVLADSLTATRDFVWVGEGFTGTLMRVAASDGQVAGPFFPGARSAGSLTLAADAANLWVGERDDSVLRLDPASLQVRASTQVPGRVIGLAVTPSAVWSIQFRNTDVRRIDPVTAMSSVAATVGSAPTAIAVGAGSVWVGTRDARLWRMSSVSGEIDTSLPVGVAPRSIIVQGDNVWVVGDNLLDEVAASTGDLVRSIHFGHELASVAVTGSQLLVTVDE